MATKINKFLFFLRWNVLTVLMAPRTSIHRILDMQSRAQNYLTLKEVFIDQAYHFLVEHAPAGSIVIDIGANIGDTAIYFAQFPNIKKVIAFEPMPAPFEEAKANISASPFTDKIILVNAAVGISSSRRISADSYSNASSSFYDEKEVHDGHVVESYRLNKILETWAKDEGFYHRNNA